MKTNIKRRGYQTKNRKNNKAKWLILLFFTINALTALVLPYSLDVINGAGDRDYFPRAIVHAETIVEPILEVTDHKDETTKEKITRIAKEKCSKQGLGDFCWKDLVGIAYAEHHDFNCSMKGDSNWSVGCYQIYRAVHKTITVEQAMDIDFATNWTLNRLIYYGYPKMRSYSIMKHNGTPGIPATLKYLETVNNYISTL